MQFIIEITHLRQEVSTRRPGFAGHQHRLWLMVALIFNRDRATEDGIAGGHCRQKNRGEMQTPLLSYLHDGGDYPQSLAGSQQEASHYVTSAGV